MPKFVGLFKVLKHIGKVAYQFVLSTSMDCIHNVFHVPLLCKHISAPTYVPKVEDVELKENIVYEKLTNKQIPLVKVLLRNH